MSHIYSLGAINKQTGEYVYPKIANKKDEYICPECNKDLILCQGEVRSHYFRHKVDTINPCNHYNNPSESQIHKDAKLLLKTILEKRIPITFIRNYVCCKTNEEFEIPEITDTSIIQLEYRFEYNGTKIADVAYIDNGEIICIFEICNTHKTCNENRPEPWFEINAETLINMVNDMNLTSLEIPCIRSEKCDECIEYEKNILIENIRKINNAKLPKLETNLTIANQNFNDDFWCRGDYGSTMYETQIKNIKDEVEIKLIKQNIKYINNDNKSFTIQHPITMESIELKSLTIISIGQYGYCNITIEQLYNWYFNIEKNVIDREIKHNKLIIQLLKYVELQDTEKTNYILNKIKKYKFIIPNNIEIDFVQNNVKFSKNLQGYIFIHPKTNFKIKYSNNNKLFLNGKWYNKFNHTEIIKWYNSEKNKIDEILNLIKFYKNKQHNNNINMLSQEFVSISN